MSYHPSIVKRRKIEYTLSAGFPKYCGAELPNRNVVAMLTTNSRTPNPKETMKDVLNASLRPFTKLSILGTNLSSLNDLKARKVLNDKRTPVPGVSNPKMLRHEGTANSTIIKSKRFQPSDQ